MRWVEIYIIGMVGPFGSGCTYVANSIGKLRGYKVISLSDELRELFKTENPKAKVSRKILQDYGDEIRKVKGAAHLAELVWGKIEKDTNTNYVIDSIRNPEEILYLRKKHAEFYLFGVFAEPDVRWKRVSSKYSDDRREFDNDDMRDSGEKFAYGQRVTDSFRMADITILNGKNIIEGNDNDKLFNTKIQTNIDLIEKKIPFRPTSIETHMTMAYASSMRSSCLKRKVGAIIVDESGNTFSSGYNEVPLTNMSCLQEYGACYRDKLKTDYKESLTTIIKKDTERDKAYNLFKSNFKILDYCRALHAEENAILNVARIGASTALPKSILFTTTYPCNLCANKIAQVGIKHIVYFEPYPMPDAKKILSDQHIVQEPFEGVTYNGYFRIMEVID
jgi:deoxycytidylate deaminase/dephospho-CoA kinase